jgi:hypothetical protein
MKMPQNKSLKIVASSLLVILILGGVHWYKSAHEFSSDSHAKWQAVFLTDGQVYFGQLGSHNKRFALLKDVYYLKYTNGLQQDKAGDSSTLSSRNLNLIKLGGEAHGPEGEMFIAKDKILFFENLKETSTVVQAIEKNGK